MGGRNPSTTSPIFCRTSSSGNDVWGSLQLAVGGKGKERKRKQRKERGLMDMRVLGVHSFIRGVNQSAFCIQSFFFS